MELPYAISVRYWRPINLGPTSNISILDKFATLTYTGWFVKGLLSVEIYAQHWMSFRVQTSGRFLGLRKKIFIRSMARVRISRCGTVYNG